MKILAWLVAICLSLAAIGYAAWTTFVSPFIEGMESGTGVYAEIKKSVGSKGNCALELLSGNDKVALPLCKEAAEQGDAEAQYFLGAIYQNIFCEAQSGDCVPKDPGKAFKWYQKAAEQGHAPSQFSLGNSYAAGEGVPQDNQKAYIWFSLAAENGDEFSSDSRDEVAKSLSPDELRAADEEIKNRLSN